MLATVLLPALLAVAAADPPPAPAVRLPALPAGPVTPPSPMPSPETPTRVTPDLVYAFDADAPCVVLVSPASRARVSAAEGPLRLRGRFADDPSKVQTRTFAGKVVYELEPLQDGPCELLVVPAGAADAGQVLRRQLLIATGVAPLPPPPTPGPTPPTPGVSPFPAGEGLRCLVVFDAAVDARIKLPTSQQLILSGKRSRDALDQLCRVGADGKTRDWRMWPEGTDGSTDAAPFADLMKRKRDKLPWLYLGGGKGQPYDGPLPADPDAFDAAVKAASGS